MQSSDKFTKVVSIIAFVSLMGAAPCPVAAQSTAAPAPSRRSSLPDEALKLAQQAEQHLAANEPDKAIAVLRDLDKQFPNQSAISLRLAQINDTLNRNGYALFYYRRYVNQAGPRARDIGVERVSTLELMAGIDAEVQKAARELGEKTAPVSTPVPKIERQLVTQAKDGSRVPINSEKDLERLQKQGVPQSAPTAPQASPRQAYVIPAELTATQTPTPIQQKPPANTVAAATPQRNIASSPAPKAQASVYAKATPQPPDEDALMANAFSKAGSDMSDVPVAPEPPEVSETPNPSVVPDRANTFNYRNPPVSKPRTVKPSSMAFTKQTPVHESPRVAAFFNVSQGTGPQAQVAIVNDLPAAVVTFSLTPEDDGEVISAILLPGEKRTLLIKPARYDLSANASSNDYSPITLLNTHFKYNFDAGRLYTRRFNKAGLERVN